jgi:hypothetical protein
MAKNGVFLTISFVEKPVKSKIIVRYSGCKATKRANPLAFSSQHHRTKTEKQERGWFG